MLDVQLFMSVVTGFVVFIKGSTLTVYHDCATGNRFLAFDCLQCHEKGVEHKGMIYAFLVICIHFFNGQRGRKVNELSGRHFLSVAITRQEEYRCRSMLYSFF